MAPKKKARTGEIANVSPGVGVDPILGDAGEHTRGEDNPPTTTLPDSTTRAQTAPVPYILHCPIPPTDIPDPPSAPVFGPGVSYGDLSGAIQMLAQIVASQNQR